MQLNRKPARGARRPDLSHIAERLRPFAVPLGDLTPDPANARKHGARSLEAIAASLKRFGQQKPAVYDESGVLVAGNGMLAAAKALGWSHLAAVKSGLAGVERAAYGIADNRTAELSEWDDEALSELISAMPADAVEAMGFMLDELVELGLVAEPELEDDEVPGPVAPAVARMGDLWRLGDHRLLCGDSTKVEDIARVMDGDKADLVATDPPYVVGYTGERPGKGKDWSATYREIDIVDAEAFYRSVFVGILSVLGDHAAIYCWHAHMRVGLIQRLWGELGILDHQQIVWIKPTPVLGRAFWHFQHEPCIMGWRKGSKPGHDGRHHISSVWVTAAGGRMLDTGESDVWLADWEGKARVVGNEHPTQKPIEIFARPMRKHTRAGAIVFEPFSGSGTQLVAAEKLGRRCRAIELQPVFVDVAIRRWQAITGRDATLEQTGRTWTETAVERAGCRGRRRSRADTRAAPPSPRGATAPSTRRSTRGKAPRAPRPRGGTGTGGRGSVKRS